MKIQRAFTVACCVVLLSLCTAVTSSAQDQTAVPGGSTSVPDASIKTTDQTTAPSSAPDPLAVHSLGNLFSVDQSVWRFGPFYLNSVSFGEGYYLGTTNGQDFSSSMTTVGAALTFDHRISRARFTLQYQPQLYIIDGNVLNGSQTDLNLNTGVQLSSTVTWNLYDDFGSRGNQTPNGAPFAPTSPTFVSLDPTTGKFYQSPFTTGAARSYYNTGGTSLDWRASQRLTLDLNGSAGYSWYGSGSGSTLSAASLDSITAQAGVTASYMLGPSRAVTGGFTYEQARISAYSNTTSYYNFVMGYDQTIGRSWHYSLSGGGIATNTGVGGITWGGTGNVSVSKTFRTGSIGVTAGRQLTSGGPFITSSTYDRADATYSQSYGRKWSSSMGVGYFRGVSPGVSQSARSKYAMGQVGYLLHGNIHLYASCSHFFQNGDGVQLIQTRGWQFSSGIQWVPGGQNRDSR